MHTRVFIHFEPLHITVCISLVHQDGSVLASGTLCLYSVPRLAQNLTVLGPCEGSFAGTPEAWRKPVTCSRRGAGAGQGGAAGDKGEHRKAPPLFCKCSAREPAFPHFVHRQPSLHASSHMNSYHALKNGNSTFKNSRKQRLLRTVFCEDRWPYDTHTPITPGGISK